MANKRCILENESENSSVQLRQTVGLPIAMLQYSSRFNMEQNRELRKQAFQKDGESILD